MDSSGPSSSNAVNEGGGSQQYNPHPSQLPLSNFVSIKLSGETNYYLWKKQMMCLLEYHDMVGFIDGTIRNPDDYYYYDDDDDDDGGDDDDDNPMDDNDDDDEETKFKEWNKSKDTLVKGWIFGTLSEDVLGTVINLDNAYRVWEELKDSYHNSLKAELFTKKKIRIAEEVAEAYIPLQRAIEKGDMYNTKELLNKKMATLTAKINWEGDTPLHLAVGTCQNIPFLDDLLMNIEPTSLPTLVNYRKYTTLHHAALFGNTDPAKMLVEKSPCLLFIADEDGYLPILRALVNYHEQTFLYLLEVSKQHIDLIYQNRAYQNPFEGTQGSLLLCEVISQEYLDVANELICEYPNLVISKDKTTTPLWFIVTNQNRCVSAITRYNSCQRFIYSFIKRIYAKIWDVLLHG